MWSEILEMADVGPDESFIELGGDSIAATLCINRIYKAFGCEISFAMFLEPDMTPRKLAALVDQAAQPAAGSAASVERVLG